MKPFILTLAGTALLVPLPAWTAGEPTNLRAATPFLQSASMELSWDDNCDEEDGFDVQFSSDGLTGWSTFFSPTKNTTLLPVTGGGPGSVFYFRIRATSPGGDSDWTDSIQVTLPADIAILDATFAGGVVGEPLTGPTPSVFTNPPGGSASAFSVTDLPDGLLFDPVTGIISGTPTTPGVFRPILSATDGTNTASTFVTLRIRPAPSGPVTITAPGPVDVLRSGPGLPLDLGNHFTDPDTPSAAILDTNVGALEVRLFDQSTPATVENFYDYLDNRDYDDAAFHRSVDSASPAGVDIIQSGWFRPAGVDYEAIPTNTPVINEPGLPNIRGSIAVAKLGGNPSSGTSQFYFNVQPNSNLDTRANNGGFTVFGQLSTASLAVMDDIHSRPTGDYSVQLNALPRTIVDWPTTAPPLGATPSFDELVRVITARRRDPLGYTRLLETSRPDLFVTTLTGSALEILPTGTGLGEGLVQLQVADLDGTTLDYDLVVRIVTNLADWRANHVFPGEQDGPLDDGDHDLVPNLLEYAFGGAPDQADSESSTPEVVLLPGAAAGFRFFHHRYSTDLHYRVRKSADLENWTTVWESTDGFDSPLVVEKSESGDFWSLTISDPAFTPATSPDCFFLVEVSLPN